MIAAAVIVAAGKGERFGNAGKILARLNDRPVLEYSVDTFDQISRITEIVIVAGPHTEDAINRLVSASNWSTPIQVVRGGETRQVSTSNGVNAVSVDAEVILVHDAARPLVQPDQVEACIAAASEFGAAIVAAPVTDTIKQAYNLQIETTIDRSALWAAQTPQGFRADVLRDMMSRAAQQATLATDEASLAELSGHPVRIVPGNASNLKITHPTDIIIAEALLRARKELQ